MPTVAATLDNNTQIKAQFGCKMTLVWGNFGINNYARQALVAAYANKSAMLDEKSVRHAVAEADSK